MADSNNKNGTSSGTEAYATTETIHYIRRLHRQWMEAQTQLTKYQTSLSNLQNQKKNIGEEFTRIRKTKADAESNLKDAKTALEKVILVVEFFESRVDTTKTMLAQGYNMALKMFEATEFVNKEGMKRVEEIQELVTGFNKKESSDTSQQWSDSLTSSITTANAQSVAAFKAGSAAVIESFKAYVSNQQINARTQYYLQKFTIYERWLRNIITRLGKELALVNRRYIVLLSNNTAIDLQVDSINQKVQELEFDVAKYHAEFNAAQQGAEYKFTPSSSPAG